MQRLSNHSTVARLESSPTPFAAVCAAREGDAKANQGSGGFPWGNGFGIGQVCLETVLPKPSPPEAEKLAHRCRPHLRQVCSIVFGVRARLHSQPEQLQRIPEATEPVISCLHPHNNHYYQSRFCQKEALEFTSFVLCHPCRQQHPLLHCQHHRALAQSMTRICASVCWKHPRIPKSSVLPELQRRRAHAARAAPAVDTAEAGTATA